MMTQRMLDSFRQRPVLRYVEGTSSFELSSLTKGQEADSTNVAGDVRALKNTRFILAKDPKAAF